MFRLLALAVLLVSQTAYADEAERPPSKAITAHVQVGCLALDDAQSQGCKAIVLQMLHAVDAAEQDARACTILRKQGELKVAQQPCRAATERLNMYMTLQKLLYERYPSVKAFAKRTPFYYI